MVVLTRNRLFLVGSVGVAFLGGFWYTYKKSNEKGIRRFLHSWKIAVIYIIVMLGGPQFSNLSSKEVDTIVLSPPMERLVSSFRNENGSKKFEEVSSYRVEELAFLEVNSYKSERKLGEQVTLVNDTPSSSSTSGNLGKSGPGARAKGDARSAARANRGKSSSFFAQGFPTNPYRHRQIPKVQEPLEARNRRNPKNQSEQCELDENKPVIELVYRIKKNPALVREAQRMGKDQAAQKDVNNLIEKLSLGNKNPGIGNRRVQGLKNVSEARGRNEGRVYFRKKDGKIEILGKSTKDNQEKVIAILEKMGY